MIRNVVWFGDSKRRLKEFPKDVQQTMGGALMIAQFGGTADNVKFCKIFGMSAVVFSKSPSVMTKMLIEWSTRSKLVR